MSHALSLAVPLYGRAIHLEEGGIQFQSYGNGDEEVLHAIRRQDLHSLLVEAAMREDGVELCFQRTLETIDLQNRCANFRITSDKIETVHFGLFLGADGAFAKSRELLNSGTAASENQEVSPWNYIEVQIPASAGGTPSLTPNYLHLWPRRDSFLCAIPNLDGSFTGNLIMRSEIFTTLGNSPNEWRRFLDSKYPKIRALIRNLPIDIAGLKPRRIITTRLARWHFGEVALLLGDACHSISPFLGQGMNAALNDALTLAQVLRSHEQANLGNALEEFQSIRKPETDALADLSEHHLLQLSTHLGSEWNLALHAAELKLQRLAPQCFKPTYSQIAHSSGSLGTVLAGLRAGQSRATHTALKAFQLLYYLGHRLDQSKATSRGTS